MGWADCGDDSKGRPIGYGHAAICDQEGCTAEIHRGLAYACGGMHGSSPGCEGYFCDEHMGSAWDPGEQQHIQVCAKCEADLENAKAEAYKDVLLSAVRVAAPAPDFKPIDSKRIDVFLQGHFVGSLKARASGSWEFVDEGFTMTMGQDAPSAVSRCIEHFTQPPLTHRQLRARIMALMVEWDDEDLHLLPTGSGLVSEADEKAIVAAKERHARWTVKIEPNHDVMDRLKDMARERNAQVRMI
ncbi:hypothetical protein HOU03_gp306 [Caulobacter phage CcrSC]|uniref:Uncharacterized protein n=1 Tax=Caulobacter phage CcrSC TaxID=2283272 RepID=A0A385EG95_9CAUD|nr:hypothetical protein HOU03_gp306 [Caulobacter phage CcrSC]AXQ69962.1 hypothetical protein CcrSC_gp380 [Caulobacter phage CcrSC]